HQDSRPDPAEERICPEIGAQKRSAARGLAESLRARLAAEATEEINLPARVRDAAAQNRAAHGSGDGEAVALTQPFAAVDAYVVELERLFEFTRYLHRSSGRAYPDTPLLALPPSQFCLKLLNPQRPPRPTRGKSYRLHGGAATGVSRCVFHKHLFDGGSGSRCASDSVRQSTISAGHPRRRRFPAPARGRAGGAPTAPADRLNRLPEPRERSSRSTCRESWPARCAQEMSDPES